jgi:2-keto-4-pentenoate hydratase/2-oxohepta-3-ene-1,7-dioic acid hydratase in catechol pathway
MSKKYCRLLHEGRVLWALCEGKTLQLLDGPPYLKHELTAATLDVDDVKLLAPVEPSKIICVGLNYQGHVKESATADVAPEEPLLFSKPPSAVIAPEAEIVGPPESERVDYEGEIGVVIGLEGRHIEEDAADRYIFGVTCVNDVTARDLQRKDKQWVRAKGFDTFCPVGPYLVTDLDYLKLDVQTRLNGEKKQSGNSSQMIFPIPKLVNYISSIMTLLPGDLIVTGTPEGVSPMSPGDIVEVEVEGVGILRNTMTR